MEAAPFAVIAIDLQGNVIEFNREAEAVFGHRRGEALGIVDRVVPARSRQRMRARLARLRITGTSVLLGRWLQGSALRADGSEFSMEFITKRIPGQDPPALAIYVQETTQRRQFTEERARYRHRLRALAAELLLAEEHERRRLASDLHDGLSQTISLVQMKLAALHRPGDLELEATLNEVRELVVDADRSARSITYELSPPILHDLGLQPAVEWLIDNIRSRYEIEVELEADDRDKPADGKVRVIVFRAIRELLINAAKHASASRVWVQLGREEDGVSASIEDDGAGMDPRTAMGKGAGLLSIRERLHYVGGYMRMESARGRGTKIRLWAPLVSEVRKAVEASP